MYVHDSFNSTWLILQLLYMSKSRKNIHVQYICPIKFRIAFLPLLNTNILTKKKKLQGCIIKQLPGNTKLRKVIMIKCITFQKATSGNSATTREVRLNCDTPAAVIVPTTK